MYEFVGKAYFDAVQKAMVEKGFAHISTVTVSSDDVPYHVLGEGRSTTMFFHLKGNGLVVQLEYHETRNCPYSCDGGYWALDFYVQFRSVEELVRMNMEAIRKRYNPEEFWPSDHDPYEGIPLLYDEVALSDFKDLGGGVANHQVHRQFEQKVITGETMHVNTLLTNVQALIDPVMPYIMPGRIDELQVTCFPPYYAFPKCEPIFWERFDLVYFKKAVVRRPWGSDMRKVNALRKDCKSVSAEPETGLCAGCADLRHDTEEMLKEKSGEGRAPCDPEDI